MKSEVLIQLDELFFFYNLTANKKLPVIKGISFKINAGQLVGVFGPSGSGKTTLLDLILGKIEPLSGNINISDDLISYLPQQPEKLLISHMSVENWLQFIRSKSKLGNSQFNELLDEILNDWGIKEFKLQKIEKLSGGQKQRLSLASVLLRGSRILLLDEPTSMVHQEMKKIIIQTIKQYLRKFNSSALLVTHAISVGSQCDRIFELFDGSLRLAGKFQQHTIYGDFVSKPFTLNIDNWGRIVLPIPLLDKIRIKDTVKIKVVDDKIIILRTDEI